MSFINQVLLVGDVKTEPKIATSSKGNRYLTLELRTGRPFSRDGKTEFAFVTHKVVVFKEDKIDLIAAKAPVGTWIKVVGEIGYARAGAQVVVGSSGDIGLMFSDLWRPNAEMTEDEAELLANGSTKAATAEPAPSTKKAAPSAPKSAKPQLDDDDIPF